MAKIEVVIDGDQVPAVRDLFIEAGATGYTGLGRLRVRSPRPPPGPAAVQRPCQPVHAHPRRAPRQGPVAGHGPSAPARGPARGLLRHLDPREPPPTTSAERPPGTVDGDLVGGRQHPDGGHGLQRGQVPGSATGPSGTTARSARWWHAGQLSLLSSDLLDRCTAPGARHSEDDIETSPARRFAGRAGCSERAARSNAASPMMARRRGQQWARKSVSTRASPSDEAAAPRNHGRLDVRFQGRPDAFELAVPVVSTARSFR